jgi:glycosyltransferase involved in cell wall biosynthesis
VRDEPAPPNTVSVIVPCYNEVKNIESFLESFLLQDLNGIDCEIIVAEGISQDGTRQVLEKCREKLPKLVIVDNPNRIVSTGLNAAIRKAGGEVIIRMDVHTEYASNYIRRCVSELERTSADNVGGPARTRAKARARCSPSSRCRPR